MNELVKSQKFKYICKEGFYIIGIETKGGIRPFATLQRNIENPKGTAEGLVKILNQQKNYILPI